MLSLHEALRAAWLYPMSLAPTGQSVWNQSSSRHWCQASCPVTATQLCADSGLGTQAAASLQSTKQKQSLQHEELQAKTFHNSSDKVNIKAQVLAQPHTAPVEWLTE